MVATPEKPVGLRFDQGKLDWTLLNFQALGWFVKVAEYGIAKGYPRDNWKHLDEPRCVKSLVRHALLLSDGQWLDEESGLPHAAHIGNNVMYLLYLHYVKENKVNEAQ